MSKANTIEVKVAKTDRDFVGIKVNKNHASITFPIGYDIKEEVIATCDKEKIGQLYIDVKILVKNIEEAKDELYGTGYQEFSFSSGIYILEDFLKNGLYCEPKNQCKKNTQGKIQWRKTIQTKEPVYSAGKYIYLDTYNYNICHTPSKITQIQKYCLNISSKILGWLFNCSSMFDELDMIFTKEEMIYELLTELNKTNEDVKKKLLEQMLLFLNGTETSLYGREEFEVGTYYFDKVWEKVLRCQAYFLYPHKKCIPTTYYFIEDKILNSKLLPDITVEKDKKIVIMDAKYYKLESLPQSADICKQLFYGQYIMNENKKSKIMNVFILPQKVTNEMHKQHFFQVGYANAEHLNEKHRIWTYYLDTKSVMMNRKIMKDVLEELFLVS